VEKGNQGGNQLNQDLTGKWLFNGTCVTNCSIYQYTGCTTKTGQVQTVARIFNNTTALEL